MDSVSLETFLAVYQEKSVSAAAKRLGRTQSAISHRLTQFESSIGARLFERTGRNLVLSSLGLSLLPYAEQVTAMIKDAVSVAEDATRDAAGILNIALVGTLASSDLTHLFEQLHSEFPKCDLRISTGNSNKISDLVRKGDASIGLRYFDDPSPDTESAEIWREPLIVICSPQHRLAHQKLSSLKSLGEERWLAFPDHEGRKDPFSSTIFSHFSLHGITNFDWVAIDSLTAQKRLVEAGFGIALMQKSGVQEELKRGSLAIIELEDLKAAMPVVSIARKNGYQNEACKWLLNKLTSQ